MEKKRRIRTIKLVGFFIGEQADTSHGILSAGGSINEEMTSRGRALFEQFYPIEQSTNLTDEEKLPHMIKWFIRKIPALSDC